MIDLDKLNKLLDEALESESAESLSLWMEEQTKADRECGIMRNEDFEIPASNEAKTFLAIEDIVEIGITEHVSYYASEIVSDEFEIDNNYDYNLAS